MTINKLPTIYQRIKKTQFLADIMKLSTDVGNQVLLSCLSPKYSSWVYFVNIRQVKKALIFDTNAGLDAIVLSRYVDNIVVIVQDKLAAVMLKDRFQYEQIQNIEITISSEFSILAKDNKYGLVVCRDVYFFQSFFKNANDFFYQISCLLECSGTLFLGFIDRPKLGFFSPVVKYSDKKTCKSAKVLSLLTKHNFIVHDIVFCFAEQFFFDEILTKQFLKSWQRPTLSFKAKIKNLIIKFLYPRLAPNKNYIMSKSSNTKCSLLDSILDRLTEIIKGQLKVRRIFVGNPDTLVILLESFSEKLIIRLPMSKIAQKRTENQYNVLNALNNDNRLNKLTIPSMSPPFYVNRQKVYVETMLEGVILDEGRFLSKKAEKNGVEWLINFHLLTVNRTTITQTKLDELIKLPFRSLLEKTNLYGDVCKIKKISEICIEKFARCNNFPFVCMHGDFKIENMLFSRDHSEVTGVFDWDLAKLTGLPVIDLLYFLAYSEKLKNESLSISLIIHDKFIKGEMSDWERIYVEKYMNAIEVPMNELIYYSIMAWLYHVAYRLDNNIYHSNSFYEENIVNVLSMMEELL